MERRGGMMGELIMRINMKAGYKIVNDSIQKDTTILEVVNWKSDNVIEFYAWNDNDDIEIITSTVGFWKIKCVHDWKTNIQNQYSECRKCGKGHAL